VKMWYEICNIGDQSTFYEVRVFSEYSSVDGLLFRRQLFRGCSIQYSEFLIIGFLYVYWSSEAILLTANIRSILLQYHQKNYTVRSAEDVYAQSYRSVGYKHCP